MAHSNMKKKSNQAELEEKTTVSLFSEGMGDEVVTSSGVKLESSYGDVSPGVFPYTRGPYKSMYRKKLWTMRQYSGFGSAKETNARFRYLLKNGQTGLSCAFDLPTQMGFDSDHEMAEGEVGRVGVAISSIDDMDLLLKDLPLDQLSTSMTINATAATLLCLYVAIAKKRGISPNVLRGTIQNDILKEYVARGTYIYPPEFSLALVADTFRFSNAVTPKWNPISISGYHIREAGCTAAQEIAFTLSHGFTYVKAALEAGLKKEDFVPRLSFFFNVHNNFYEEIAKFRVARKIYAEQMVKRFDCPKEFLGLRFHAQTAGSTLTAQQPLNNAIRVAYQAMAAVMGGAQSLHTNSFDEALSLPTEESALLALRTQQILAAETGVPAVADPFGGSKMMEEISAELEQKALEIIRQIDEQGGVLKAISNGFIQREIQTAAFVAQKKIDSCEQPVIGVNCFSRKEAPRKNLHKLNQSVVVDQLKRLRAFKSKRSFAEVKKSLAALRLQAQRLKDGDPKARVCECILSAIESHATLGEVAETMRDVAGTYRA